MFPTARATVAASASELTPTTNLIFKSFCNNTEASAKVTLTAPSAKGATLALESVSHAMFPPSPSCAKLAKPTQTAAEVEPHASSALRAIAASNPAAQTDAAPLATAAEAETAPPTQANAPMSLAPPTATAEQVSPAKMASVDDPDATSSKTATPAHPAYLA